MRNRFFIIFAFLVHSLQLFPQSDTLISFDCRTKQIQIIPPPTVNSTKDFDNTDWHIAQGSEIQLLESRPPVNTSPGSGFTYVTKAHPTFDVNKFPVSATVNIKRYVNDSLFNWCTGTMVSSNLVLTCAHGIWLEDIFFIDSVLVAPGYDNNTNNPLFGTAVSRKFYISSRWYHDTGWQDIALIELDKPLGNLTGWMGIAFNDDPRYFDNRVLHKFSYPGNDYYDYPQYCGDTLYYNYGIVDVSDFGDVLGLGFNFPSFIGQSGSSLFYTDNDAYLIYGTLSISSDSPPLGPISLHYRIKPNMFYPFKNIIEKTDDSIQTPQVNTPDAFLLEQNYPNPFNPSTCIRFNLPTAGTVTVKVFNMAGQEIQTILSGYQTEGVHEAKWEPNDQPSGIYFARLQSGASMKTIKLLFQK